MIVGIDGSNLRTGGGVTHISRLLAAARPADHGITEIRLWTAADTAAALPRTPLLNVVHDPMLDRRLWWRLYWQRMRLPALAAECDVLFVPGGNLLAPFSPSVTMSRNLLPFEWPELLRYRRSIEGVRLLLRRFGQTRTYRRSEGLIFLTEYARAAVLPVIGRAPRHVTVIPHGVDERFRAQPRPQRSLAECSDAAPLRLLYVSKVDLYKHQWNVAEAVARLRSQGLPVEIDFVGPTEPQARALFDAAIERLDREGRFLHRRGAVAFDDLPALRDGADVFVFASSCENMPNTLLEAMASGFPIACARRGPMPEILGEDGGVYFDPERVDEIEHALRRLAEDAPLRARCAKAAYERASAYSWERCARETFAFIAQVARDA